ncbi:MAG: hypothetical protein Q9160_003728 [Pyrenula sp. 1 TL-2023]
MSPVESIDWCGTRQVGPWESLTFRLNKSSGALWHQWSDGEISSTDKPQKLLSRDDESEAPSSEYSPRLFAHSVLTYDSDDESSSAYPASSRISDSITARLESHSFAQATATSPQEKEEPFTETVGDSVDLKKGYDAVEYPQKPSEARDAPGATLPDRTTGSIRATPGDTETVDPRRYLNLAS